MPVLSPLISELTNAGTADLAAIAALAEKIWRIHYPPIIGEKQTDYMLKKMYSEASILADMQNGQQFAFIEEANERIGYLGWSYPAHGELFIHKFYIEPSSQNKGTGRRAFQKLLDKNPGVKTIRLTVNRKNYKSINFYFRLGFVIEEVKDFDIGNGFFMNDFVMVWRKEK